MRRYCLILAAVPVLLCAPGSYARIVGASPELLFRVALFQLLGFGALLLTMPISLLPLALKCCEWPGAGWALLVLAIPPAGWFLLLLTNGPGWAAVISV